MNINSKTSLTKIRQAMLDDFGITITNNQAKEIRTGRGKSTSVWTSEHYISTNSSDDIQRVDARGVKFSAYGTFYKTDEWNKAVSAGEFA